MQKCDEHMHTHTEGMFISPNHGLWPLAGDKKVHEDEATITTWSILLESDLGL